MIRKVKDLLFDKMIRSEIMSLIVCIVLVSAFFAYFLKTRAWFSMNTDVEATGITIQSDVTANLIIGSTPSKVKGITFLTTELTTHSSTVKYGPFLPATYEDGEMKTYALGDVDPQTGLAKTSTTMVTAVNPSDKSYYYYTTFTTYLGAAGHTLNCDNISASFTGFSTSGEDFFKAIAIDVIVGGTYKGTLEAKDLSKTIDLGITSVATNSPVQVDLRVYFNGDATDSNGKAIIRSATVGSGEATLGVTFTAINPSTGA